MGNDFESVETNLKYSVEQLDTLLEFLEQHEVDEGGRYRMTCSWGEDNEPDENIIVVMVFTHPTSLSEAKAESISMCAFRIKVRKQQIELVAAAPGFDIDVAWLELWKLEKYALGHVLHGKR